MNKFKKINYNEYREFLPFLQIISFVSLMTHTLTINRIDIALKNKGFETINKNEVISNYIIVKLFEWEKHIVSQKPHKEEVTILFTYDMFSDIRNYLFNELRKIDNKIQGEIPAILYPPELGSKSRRFKNSIGYEAEKHSKYTQKVIKYFNTLRFTHPNLDNKNSKDTYQPPNTKQSKIFHPSKDNTYKPNWSEIYSKTAAAETIGISTKTIDNRIKVNPKCIIKLSRQQWKFDKNDPLFEKLR